MMAALFGMICMMSMMPGPATTVILDTTVAHGRKMGFLTAIGGSAGVGIYALLALLIGTVLSSDGLWVSVLEGVGAIYLAALGVMSLIEAFTVNAKHHGQAITTSQVSRAFVTGLLSTCLSPKTALFYLVILSQFDFQALPVFAGILLAGLTHVIVRMVWYGSWIHLLHPMRDALDGLWLQRSMKLITGALMMALSVHVLL